jgi:maleate isomerase
MTAAPTASHPCDDRFIGMVVPYDMALDRELWRWAPPGVSLLFTRTPYNDLPVTVEMAETVGDVETVVRSTRELCTVGPIAYAYGCTSGSFVNGVAGERRLAAAMREAGNAPAVTTSGALLATLDALGVSQVATATPYDNAVTGKLTTFLEEAGLGVVSRAHLGLSGDIWTVDYETTRRLVREADSEEAEAIVVSCTNLATYDVIAPLEAELGKPVVTANQVTMWAALRAIGMRCVGPGQRVAAL